MDLSAWLLRHTPPRPLVVTTPGGTAARLAVEREVRTRGWAEATSPAEANILVVAGPPALEAHVSRVWDAFPAPRARAGVTGPADARAQLDSAVQVLRDAGRQRAQATRSAPEPSSHSEHGGHHDMTQHGHDMTGLEMPGGVPMADRAEDRDGLILDQLHVPLGPLLPHWPAGLTVHTRLQGDVIQHATVELHGAGDPWSGDPAARWLDASARLLALTGWTDAAVRAQRLRDEALEGVHVGPEVRRWARRVRRSRTLRWLLAGVGEAPDAPPSLAGDTLARLYRWLDSAEESRTSSDETQWTVDTLPELLTGTDLAAARLIVASLDPNPDMLTHAGADHG